MPNVPQETPGRQSQFALENRSSPIQSKNGAKSFFAP